MAKIVDEQYQVFDFSSWSDLSAKMHDEHIQLTQRIIRCPRVVMLQFYDRLPRQYIRFSRENVYLRDKNTCQYCGKRFSRADLNIDHVIPVSQGGGTTWNNVVCSCLLCNNRKGGRTPEQARIALLSKPASPKYSLFMQVSPQQKLFDIWHLYMNPVDFAYWNLELKD